jgi:hypothetical protein
MRQSAAQQQRHNSSSNISSNAEMLPRLAMIAGVHNIKRNEVNAWPAIIETWT